MLTVIPGLVADNILELAEVGLTQRDAERHLRQSCGRLATTLAMHFRAPVVTDGPTLPSLSGPVASIEGLLDIEESIWAPKYGLKGVVDATVLARPWAVGPGQQLQGFGLAAVEFKSGKAYFSHAAQVGLYGLLLESRYGTNPVGGLLWYSSRDAMEPVLLNPIDIAGAVSIHSGILKQK
jgi:DNA replication ATP-dependent helicase Dna2